MELQAGESSDSSFRWGAASFDLTDNSMSRDRFVAILTALRMSSRYRELMIPRLNSVGASSRSTFRSSETGRIGSIHVLKLTPGISSLMSRMDSSHRPFTSIDDMKTPPDTGCGRVPNLCGERPTVDIIISDFPRAFNKSPRSQNASLDGLADPGI